jgi:ankyrin repeat protein
MAVVEVLLARGAQVNAARAGATALCFAAWGRHSEVVARLLNHGAELGPHCRPAEACAFIESVSAGGERAQ